MSVGERTELTETFQRLDTDMDGSVDMRRQNSGAAKIKIASEYIILFVLCLVAHVIKCF